MKGIKVKNAELTNNEARALYVLITEALRGMGGEHPADFYSDTYTWCDAQDLIKHGWSRHEAAGTYGSLIEKRMINHDTMDGDALADDMWQMFADNDDLWKEFVSVVN